MKNIRVCLFILFSVVFLILSNGTTANAMQTGFETSELSSKEKNNFISNIDLSLIHDEPAKNTVICFDVNENRLIAIGQNTPDRKTICVYSSEGVFQYGYTFNSSGSFGVEWDGDNLNIYFVRGNVIVSVTPKGEVVDACEIKNTIENNSYVNNFVHSTKRTVDGIEYILKNDLGALDILSFSYSQIIIKESTNVQRVIYDVSSKQLSNVIAFIVVLFIGITIAIAVIVNALIKLKRNWNNVKNEK